MLLLTVTVIYIHRVERLVRAGVGGAVERVERAGTLAFACAVLAVVFAVLTFDRS